MNDDDETTYYRDMYSPASIRRVVWFALWVLGVVAATGTLIDWVIKCLAQ